MGRLTGRQKRQDAVVWNISSKDEYNEPTVSAAAKLRVRWVDKEGETLTPDNTVVKTDVMVLAGQEIEIGSILWQGKLRDIPATPTPLFQVVNTKTTPNVKNMETRYRVFLIRFNDTLPTIAS